MSLAAITASGETPLGRLRARLHGPEWLALAAIAVIDAIWAQHIGLHLGIHWHDIEMPCAVTAVMIALHLYGPRQASLVAEYLALSVVMAVIFTVLCYLAFGSSGPLMDRQLLAADRALGFDWLAGFKWIAAHPVISGGLGWLYRSLDVQALYVCLFLGMLERDKALREMFWIIFISAIFTNLIAIVVPAYGPFEIFGLSSHGDFLPDMKHLKSSHDLTFSLGQMTGVICFPSFHTVMALAYAWCVRRTGLVGYAIAAMNLAMLFSIPYFGGHYLVDMIAGAAVLALSLGLFRAWQHWLVAYPSRRLA